MCHIFMQTFMPGFVHLISNCMVACCCFQSTNINNFYPTQYHSQVVIVMVIILVLVIVIVIGWYGVPPSLFQFPFLL